MDNNANIKIGADINEAVDAFKQLSSTIGTTTDVLNKNFKTVETSSENSEKKLSQSFNKVGESAEKSRKKVKKEFDGMSEDVEKSSNKIKESSEKSGDGSEEIVKKVRKSRKKVKDEFEELASDIEKANKAMEDALKEDILDDFTKQMIQDAENIKKSFEQMSSDVESSLVKLNSSVQNSESGVDDLSKKIKKDSDTIGDSFQNIGDEVKKSGKIVTDETDAMAKKIKKDSDEIEKDSKKAGDGIKKIGNSAKEAEKDTTSSSSKISGGLSSLAKRIVALVAAYATLQAANAALKKGFEELGNIDSLSQTLSINTERASAYSQALKDLDISSDVFSQANTKLRASLSQNEEKLKSLGVETRNANKELLSQDEIFQNAINSLKNHKDGTDRAAAGQALFGTNLDDTNKLIQLNNENLQVAAERATLFGLMLSGETATSLSTFKQSMSDMQTAISGAAAQVLEKLLPVLTNLSNFISGTLTENMDKFSDLGGIIAMVLSDMFEIGEYIFTELGGIVSSFFENSEMQGFTWKDAIEALMGSIKIAVLTLMTALKLSMEVQRTWMEMIKITIETAILQFNALKNYDFNAVVNNAKNGFSRVAEEGEKMVSRLANVATGFKDQMNSILTIGSMSGTSSLLTGKGGILEDITSKLKSTRSSYNLRTGSGIKNFVSPKKSSESSGKSDEQNKIEEERKLLEAQFNYKKQLFENESSLREIQFDRELSSLEDMLSQGLVSYKDYYAKINEINNKKMQDDLKSKELQLEEIDRLSALAKHESERVKLSTDKLKVEGEIEQVKQRQINLQQKLARDERDALKQEREEVQKLNYEINLSNLLSSQKRMGTDSYTADKQRNDLLREYNGLLLKQAEAELKAAEASGTASELKLAQLKAQVASLKEATIETNEFAKTINEQVSGGLQSMLESVANGTKSVKDAVIGFFNDLAKTITTLVAKQLTQQMLGGISIGGSAMTGGGGSGGTGFFSSILGSLGGGSGGGSIGSFMSGLFGGGKSVGGNLTSGMSYLTGEKGPELFVPRETGNLLTAEQTKALMGKNNGGNIFNMTVLTPNANSFNASQMQVEAKMAQSVARANSRNS